jgi:hypothetical protein
MLSEDLYAQMDSLIFQIDEHEKMFDIALHNPRQLGYARKIYLNIKMLERRLADLKILLSQNSTPDQP